MKNSKISISLLLIFIFLKNNDAGAQSSGFHKLVWSDEFKSIGLPDSSKWGYDVGTGCPENCGWGNHELEYYTVKNSKNARVQNGRLIIEAHKEMFSGAQYTSARLVSKNKGNWKYGRLEIRAKIPEGKGMWPAIWMLPTNWEYGKWPHSGEIDIMENVGYWPDSILGSIHTGAYNGMMGTQKTKGIHSRDCSGSFHVYAVEWTQESISFSVDNLIYHVIKNEHTGSETWPFDKTFHLLLNIAVGGDWGGKFGVDDSKFPQRMEVDYVRVYQ